MQCPNCLGKGFSFTTTKVIWIPVEHLVYDYTPCETCNGSGITYCCEGVCNDLENGDD